MPIRAVLFDLGDTLVSYYQPQDFMPILRRSLDACLRTLGHTPLGGEARTELVHQALELNQERADLAVWPLEERLRVLFRQYAPDSVIDTELAERLSEAFLQPIFATARMSKDALALLSQHVRRAPEASIARRLRVFITGCPGINSGRSGHRMRYPEAP